ncbi:Ribosomal large subunit pseudouridine synthase C [Fundidesulfovibrio magnetotacticus]|uniref:Ribosomal large subunit pseudouridine synthase C n=1 Tax=Fundidesulfovibrio magnetotacticus TaxID=2730080 RepID=A0A6V8LUA4_9BACT|nr:RluA family pseudouridine synthase [Fundidesulfovibrio magnetotacticus]GFK93689.1 Ribosomal large subunit pseudouridine synthase C [Fundidesulfovibrio magnetotacticus]
MITTRTVSHAEAGQKLVQYLGRILPDTPGSVFMRWIRTGQVRVDGKRAKPFDRLSVGQNVRIPPFAAAESSPPAAASSEIPQLPGLQLAGFDDLYLAIAKPAGLPVHPGSGWTDSIQTRLAQAFAGQPFVPTIVHRLDRDTSGVLLAARTHNALTSAHQALKDHQAAKEYLCWTTGRWNLSPPGQTVELTDRLEKAGDPGLQRVQTGDSGKEARLLATPLAILDDRSLLLVRLLTGRTHQIRVQLASRGHPIVGDPKYGSGSPPLRLHAWRVTLHGKTWRCPPAWDGDWDSTPWTTDKETDNDAQP